MSDEEAEWALLHAALAIQRGLRRERDVSLSKRKAVDGKTILLWPQRYLPSHFSLPAARMHVWMLDRMAAMAQRRGGRLNVIGPRGSAKSTVVTLGYVVWRLAMGDEPYIWIVSETSEQACVHLANVRREIEGNERLEPYRLRGLAPGSIWRDDLLVCGLGGAVEALGRGDRTRGRRFRQFRPTLIVCDDLVGERQGYSHRERRRTREWFWGTLMPAGDKNTNVVHLCTPQHRDDLGNELLKQPGWESGKFAAIERYPERMDLWLEWERLLTSRSDGFDAAKAFFVLHEMEMRKGAILGWPERDDLSRLFALRAELGVPLFDREMQGRTPGGLDAEFPEEWFDEAIWFDRFPDGLSPRVMAVDPSEGKHAEHGDYSAIVMAGLAGDGVWYVEADLMRRSAAELAADCVRLHRGFRSDAMVLESNIYKDLLADMVEREGENQGAGRLPVWSMENRVSKRRRIQRLGPLLSQRRIKFRRGVSSCGLLVDQLRAFPHGEHDDGPDALEMALRMGEELQAA